MGERPGFVLLGRGYCHLCDDMKAALAPYAQAMGGWREVDVDRHPDLEARWGESVPVLLLGDEEVCHYHLDRQALERALHRETGRNGPPGGKIDG